MENNKTYFMNWFRVSDFPEIQLVVSMLFNDMMEQGYVGRKEKDKRKDHLMRIICRLFETYTMDPSATIAYSRNQDDYKKTRYQVASYSHTLKVVEFLEANGYINHTIGDYSAQLQSEMQATTKLVDSIEQAQGIVDMIHSDPNKELVEIKSPSNKDYSIPDGKMIENGKELIDYEDTPDILAMRMQLQKLNKILAGDPICLALPDKALEYVCFKSDHLVNFNNKQMIRVFNEGDIKHGGRYFGGWWQNIPKRFRRCIRINNDPVCELDYSGLHINMMYALKGMPEYDGDVYEIPGYTGNNEVRDFLKIVLQTLVNSKNERGALVRLRQDIKEGRVSLPAGVEDVKQLADALLKKHEPIRDLFQNRIGRKLQNLESKIASDVIDRFISLGFPILPMHDSFLVSKNLMSVLNSTMQGAYLKHMGQEISVDSKFKPLDKDIIHPFYNEYNNYVERYHKLYMIMKVQAVIGNLWSL